MQGESRLQRDVVVIGAGAAGLAAARALHAAGVQVCVLEQSPRVAASWWQPLRRSAAEHRPLVVGSPVRADARAESGGGPAECSGPNTWTATHRSCPKWCWVSTVDRVDRVGREWVVRTDAGDLRRRPCRRRRRDTIVSPSSRTGRARRQFTGEILHSAQFRIGTGARGEVGSRRRHRQFGGRDRHAARSANDSIRSAISVRTRSRCCSSANSGRCRSPCWPNSAGCCPTGLIDWAGRAAHRMLWSGLAPYGLAQDTKAPLD